MKLRAVRSVEKTSLNEAALSSPKSLSPYPFSPPQKNQITIGTWDPLSGHQAMQNQHEVITEYLTLQRNVPQI